jgi:hypothetical protein
VRVWSTSTGRPSPKAGPCATTDAHPPDFARVADPDARLGSAVGGSGNGPLHPGHVDVCEEEGSGELVEGGVIGIDHDPVVREAPGDEPRAMEALRLPDDEPRSDDAVASERDVEHAHAFGGAPNGDFGALHGFLRVAHIQDDAADRAPRRAGIAAEAEAGPQDGAAQGGRVEAVAVGVEERLGSVVDAVGEHDVGRLGAHQHSSQLGRGGHLHPRGRYLIRRGRSGPDLPRRGSHWLLLLAAGEAHGDRCGDERKQKDACLKGRLPSRCGRMVGAAGRCTETASSAPSWRS